MKNLKENLITNILLVLLILAIGIFSYIYYNSQKNTADNEPDDDKEVIESLKTIVNIDENESINVEKVEDPESLKKEDGIFYKNVESGHYIVVLPDSRRVLIYDKKDNRIINFDIYKVRYNVISESEIPESQKPLNIEIRYTDEVLESSVDQLKEILKSKSANYNVVKQSVTSSDYTEMLIVLLNLEQKPAMSQNLVGHLNLERFMDKLPAGEAPSQADVVIILGSN